MNHEPVGDYLQELSKVNNLLVNLQRELSREKAQLERAQVEHLAHLEKARSIQAKLNRIDTPSFSGFVVQTLYRPCQELGGDFFKIVSLPGGRLAILFADATGHGLDAAMEATLFNTVVDRVLLASPMVVDPAALLEQINKAFLAYHIPEQYPTVFVALLDPKTQKLTYANANGVLPRLFTESAEMILPPNRGLHIGFDPETVYQSQSFNLPSKGSLFVFTDALSEGEIKTGGRLEYGELSLFLKEIRQAIPLGEKAVDGVLRKTFGAVLLQDDLAVVVVDFDLGTCRLKTRAPPANVT